MKKFLLPALVAALVFTAGCQRFNIGPKGEGEYVIGEALVPYEEDHTSAMKRKALKAAEYNAVERAVRVFLSSSSLIEYPPSVKGQILAKPQSYIRRSYVKTAYRKGENYFLEARVMVLVSELSAKVKELEESSYAKRTNIVVASRETVGDEVSLQQYCRQGIYRALKNYPYTLLDGGNVSQNNLEDATPLIDKARKEGARFLILAEAAANELAPAAQLAANFKTMRARANVRVFNVSNYQLVHEAAENASGLDAVAAIAAQKALTGACDGAALQLAEPVNMAVHSSKTFTFAVRDVNTIDRLEKLQNILKELREVEDFSLVKYNNSNATFEVQANVNTTEELAAKIIRRHHANFTINNTGPQTLELIFIQ
ncbi:MAG: hypothetical protein LBL61_00800 [Elusimicrobiota bacterium]|jgi:hypothetical protein|nr:hypothetical protein [Elusimicrobiota bacterium]